MKRLLNTLYVTTQSSYLAKEGETVSVRVERETKLRVPIHALDGIVCFGRVSASPQLLALCGERDVTVAFMSEQGRFRARVVGPVSGNVLLRREQYRLADTPAATAEIARSVLIAKVANCRTSLQRALREREQESNADLTTAVEELAVVGRRLAACDDLDQLRGLEGEAARVYFGVFDQMVRVHRGEFFLRERSRRPPLDKLNALLSFLYTLLAHDTVSALEGVGLDPQVGFLHRDRPGRPSLALDLMEELRPLLADRLSLTLINRRQISPERFTVSESGGVLMDEKTRKTVIQAYQQRKRDTLTHPFLEEKMEVGLLPHAQAMLLARRLRGDLEGYPPFLWK